MSETKSEPIKWNLARTESEGIVSYHIPNTPRDVVARWVDEDNVTHVAKAEYSDNWWYVLKGGMWESISSYQVKAWGELLDDTTKVE